MGQDDCLVLTLHGCRRRLQAAGIFGLFPPLLELLRAQQILLPTVTVDELIPVISGFVLLTDGYIYTRVDTYNRLVTVHIYYPWQPVSDKLRELLTTYFRCTVLEWQQLGPGR